VSGKAGIRPSLKDPGVMFVKETGAPSHLDPDTLGLALRGSAIFESLPAKFSWDCEGRPAVVVYADSPIAAICLAIHIDRNLSSRGWVRCARCGKWLDQIRGRGRFCSKECRNYIITKERRNKINLLKESENEWKKLPAKSKKKETHWRWIAARAQRKSEGRLEITSSWAKQELTKLRMRKQRRPQRDSDLEGERNVTRKARYDVAHTFLRRRAAVPSVVRNEGLERSTGQGETTDCPS
jgi:hypothetical protein